MGTHRNRRGAWHRCLAMSASLIVALIVWLDAKSRYLNTMGQNPARYAAQALTMTRHLMSPNDQYDNDAEANIDRDDDFDTTFGFERADSLDDIVLVIKTGATESLQKLPIHFNTTLKSWPHVLLLSDFDEEIDGHRVYDALDIVTESVRAEEPSFETWHRLHEYGRSALDDSDPETDEQLQWLPTGSWSQRQDGWIRARFMNLPMAVKAQEFKPNARWYVFIDADSYVSWANLLRMIRRLDSSKPIYAGSQVSMGPGIFFAHGGSGYLLSQNALNTVVQQYREQQAHWDNFAQINGYGEQPLAQALLDLEIPLTWSYPQFQGGDPLAMDWAVSENGRKLWCYPAITYHHVNAAAIQGLWEFEEAWNSGSESNRAFRHSDVFEGLILPQLSDGSDWDNLSEHVTTDVASITACHEVCQRDEACVQYSFDENLCRTNSSPKLGHSKPGASSAWMLDRIERFVEDLDRQCEELMFV